MGVFRSVGMGMSILILKLLMPEVFRAFEDTLLAFFGFGSATFDMAHEFVGGIRP